MPLLDIFGNDAFSMVSMSEAIDKMDTVPGHLGSLGVFNERGIREEKVAIEKRENTLSVIQTTPRGAPLPNRGRTLTNIRDFRTVRVGQQDRILASELQFIRGFGEEMQVKMLQEEIAQRMGLLLADLQTTLENMRLGAVQGIVTDADDSTIYNYFTEFGISQPSELAFDLANKASGALREFAQKNVVRVLRRKAKGAMIQRIYALCGDDFWDLLLKNAEFRETYLNQVQARELRNGYDLEEVDFAGITWANYVGTDDNSTVAVSATEVKFIPMGPSNIFETVYAPGETFADIGQLGKQFYARVIPEPGTRDTYVDLEVLSYPLHIARRPDLLLRGKSGA